VKIKMHCNVDMKMSKAHKFCKIRFLAEKREIYLRKQSVR